MILILTTPDNFLSLKNHYSPPLQIIHKYVEHLDACRFQ